MNVKPYRVRVVAINEMIKVTVNNVLIPGAYFLWRGYGINDEDPFPMAFSPPPKVKANEFLIISATDVMTRKEVWRDKYLRRYKHGKLSWDLIHTTYKGPNKLPHRTRMKAPEPEKPTITKSPSKDETARMQRLCDERKKKALWNF